MQHPKMKIAIFEDNARFRESLEFIIVTTNDMELCGSFEDTRRLEQRIEAVQPDVVLMDINIPDKNGIEAVKEIKEKFPQVQVCMQTVFEDDDKVFEALEAGASGYLLKKTPKEKIMDALQELYEGGSPMSTQIARKVIKSFQQRNHLNEESNLLTPKEKEVLELLSKGFLYKEISEKLHISLNTVKQHIHKTYLKLHVCNRTEAVIKVYGKN